MKMTSLKLKKILEERLSNDNYRTSYNRDKDTFRIEWKESKQGMTVTLPNVISKYNQRGEEAIDELVDHITEALKIMNEEHHLIGMEKFIYPVIRSTSFPTETKSGMKLLTKEHTAETRIFYALDLGKSYKLIDEALLEKEGWTKDRIDEIASFNVRSLPVDRKRDRVADNDFYFIATQDGYDASRILNEAFLEEMKANAKGELAVAVPHQDVLIIADIENKTGYDILAQMTMKFFAEGRIPITSLSFIYEDRKLEPVFILAKNRPKKQ
ncbi:DUF1444 domain-containing protein [Virgibacillus profundi]|uniref:UPF0354 protein CIL05_06545 n=1 Tax=Virgibacillus profundi TaxID=2024555 RepID=A0A2A2IEG0_9BACI|nr:DUF1444 domain-containing protein [Virgibacillus profundi]PAV30119.1 DUF1444 domain-containing protein [Virgibacillus profundi]PXY54291.1 DUF1444 domain-containing protein [Virgibacillus profundi]